MPSGKKVPSADDLNPGHAQLMGSLVEVVQSLTQQVETLAGHVQIIHEVLDSIRDDLAWAINNDRLRCQPSVTHVTSMPADACALDWSARLNRLKPEDLPEDDGGDDDPGSDPPSPPSQVQGKLWS